MIYELISGQWFQKKTSSKNWQRSIQNAHNSMTNRGNIPILNDLVDDGHRMIVIERDLLSVTKYGEIHKLALPCHKLSECLGDATCIANECKYFPY